MTIKDDCKKNRICSIIKTYLFFNDGASTHELCDFLNFNDFKLGSGVVYGELPIIIKNNKKRNGILKDIEIKKINNKLYYKLKR